MLDQTITLLRSRGYRLTPQRLAILRILGEAEGHLTPQEICQRASALLPGLTEATVYRTLTFLSEQGLALAAHIGNGQLVYEAATHAHHHLVCRVCGQTREIAHSDLQALYDHFQESTGYAIDGMHVTFFGLCPQCKERHREDRKV